MLDELSGRDAGAMTRDDDAPPRRHDAAMPRYADYVTSDSEC